MFIIDATGSMGDEIDQLKKNLDSVVKTIRKLPNTPKLRLGMTIYRDKGDQFVTRNYDLTNDIEAFSDALELVQANGGGDEPEAVDAALDDALNKLSWSDDPNTIRMAFLIGDAPPHFGDDQTGTTTHPTCITDVEPYGEDRSSTHYPEGCSYPEPTSGTQGQDDRDQSEWLLWSDTAHDFALNGIKVVPVASSNLNKTGEYVFREIAAITYAPFLYLTYGADGRSPGSSRDDLSVPEGDATSLDQMITDVISKEVESAR